ncbi:hypothetical protein QVD17_34855 [Tagetes erecta]|uniref:Uncharacterized protein n=1 Tax=Tagetes erecta TaxID=13708 RepID=A0AAD8K2K0_TARER|nr:hypothetical protein QVD17_34855 [Tagetes erecta]
MGQTSKACQVNATSPTTKKDGWLHIGDIVYLTKMVFAYSGHVKEIAMYKGFRIIRCCCCCTAVVVQLLAFADDGYRSLNLYDLLSPVFMSEMMWILDLCAFTVWIEVLRVEFVLDLFDVASMVAWFCMLSSLTFMLEMMWILDLLAFLVWIDVLSG